MRHELHIFADASLDPATLKIIVGLIAAAGWVVTQVIGQKTKKPQRTLPPSGPASQVPPSPAPRGRERPSRAPVVIPPPLRRPTARGPVVAHRSESMYRQAPPMPPRSAPMATRPVAAPQARTRLDPIEEYHGLATPISRSLRDTSDGKNVVAAGTAPVLTRAQLLTALLQPRNLRRAYILNELLQPPLALRDVRDGYVGSAGD